MGYGEKSVGKWKKALTDWKSKTKSRAAKIRNDLVQTGGDGPSNDAPLSSVEQRLLQLMGNVAVEGDQGLKEMGFGQVIPATEVVVEMTENTESINNDHNYEGPSTSANKRCLPQQRRGRKRLRHNKSLEVSKDLLEMNQATLNVLNQIQENTADIAKSLRIIAKRSLSK